MLVNELSVITGGGGAVGGGGGSYSAPTKAELCCKVAYLD